jgi:precorrin-6B methylase 2
VFVEIGVRTGASVHLWSTFFRNLNFIGIDNNKDVVWQNENWLEGKNVKYLQADAYSLETIKKLPKEIDVIIDDGPHSLES